MPEFQQLIWFLSICLTLANARSYFNPNMTACPNITTPSNLRINKFYGKWYLAIILFDKDIEGLEDEAVCIKADFQRLNDTSLNQLWTFRSSAKYGAMTIDLPTTVEDSGQWIAISPLGAPLQVTVVHAIPKSRLVLMFCANHHVGTLVHLWTAVMTRKKKLSQLDLVELSTLLLGYGFDPDSRQLVTWHHC